MKKAIHLLTRLLGLLLLASVCPNLSVGQPLSDSVILYVDNRAELTVAVADYSDLVSSEDVTSMLQEFQRIVPVLQLRPDTAEIIRYDTEGGVGVEAGNQRTVYLRKEGVLTLTGVRDMAILQGGAFRMTITTTDMSTITDLSLVTCLEKAIAILPEGSRWSQSLYYACNGDSVTLIEKKNNELDFLELNLGAGVGLVKQQWVPDISAGIGIGFAKKGKVRTPYVSSNALFDFDAEDQMNVNVFLNVGYGWDISRQTNKKEMLGLEVGYLVSRQGELFGDNTFKLGAHWSPVKGVFVSPHLYFTDDFDRVFPGVRIGLGF